jgi:hypothetical protein
MERPHLLCENINAINKSTEALLGVSEEARLEVDAGRTKWCSRLVNRKQDKIMMKMYYGIFA